MLRGLMRGLSVGLFLAAFCALARVPGAAASVWDFEGEALEPWTATGSAWDTTRRAREGRHGESHAESLCGGEAATGVLRSPPFTIDGPYIAFLLNGWPGNAQMGRNWVRLIRKRDGTVLKGIAPPGCDAFVPVRWGVCDLIGEVVFLEAVDGAVANGYAWLGIDCVYLISAPEKRVSPDQPILTDLTDDRLVLETRYYHLEFNRCTGVFDTCHLDVTGSAGRFGPNLFGDRGGLRFVTGGPARAGWSCPLEVSREAAGVRVTVEALTHVMPAGLVLTATPDSPVIHVFLFAGPPPPPRGTKRDQPFPVGAIWAPALLLSVDTQTGTPHLAYGGRKARLPHDGRPEGLLRDSGVPAAGILDKEDPNLCLRLEWDDPSVEAVCGMSAGLAAAGVAFSPIFEGRPEGIFISLRLVPGPPEIEGYAGDLRSTISTAQPMAETFIFWLSHLGTVRDFSSRLLQATAAHLADFEQAWLTEAYSNCWTRDVAYGWQSGIYVAGPAMLGVLRDEIEVLGAAHNERGWSPTGVSPKLDFFYGNLDSMAHLINMTYDYYAKTGDVAFLREQLPNLRRQGEAMLALVDESGLPAIPEGGDTWPDLGKIRGQQTYLSALCYGALRNLSRLLQFAGQEGFALYDAAAEGIRLAANRPLSEGGLWDPARGAYIAWRDPEGNIHPPDTHGNLTAILTGLCDDPPRIASVFACLDSQWQHIYEGGMSPLAYNVDPADDTLRQWLPWIAGLDIAARARHGNDRAAETYRLLMREYERAPLPFREASGGPNDPVHGGNSGRVWDSWALLYAIYNAHFGIDLTPGHVRVHPNPLFPIDGQEVKGLDWQGRRYDLRFTGEGPHVTRVGFDGQDLPSCIFPDKSGRAEIEMGSACEAPLLLDASDGVRLHMASRETGALLLEMDALTADESLSVFWPAALGEPSVRGLSRADQCHYHPAGHTLTVALRAPGPRTLRLVPSSGPDS